MEDLKEYKEQLAQVDEALQLDPNDAELKTLREELIHLIDLTQSLHPQPPAASSSSSSPAPPPPSIPTSGSAVPNLKAGDDCMAKYAADGRWYPARVTAVSGSSKDPVFSVIFKGYNNTEMLRSPDVKVKTKPGGGGPSSSSSSIAGPSSSAPSSSAASTSSPGPSSSSSSSSSARAKLTAEEEAERERRRKRSEKKSERHELKTQVANQKANSWQKFAKKGAKKGYGIPGNNSMFKTPDDPLAKVGVVGAGRGMTGYGDRSKHVYQGEGSGRGGGDD